MTIETNLNQSPFFDDFDEDKNFHRVLFRPGYAVQARELTQMQSILQNQVERLGSEVLTNGTVLNGCDLELQQWQYVKLRDKDANNRVLLLNDFFSAGVIANSTVTGEATGLTAKLIAAEEGSESNAPNYLSVFVSYTNSGANNATKTFKDGETLIFRNSANSEFLVAANTIGTAAANAYTATGVGIGASVTGGAVYHKGHFVRSPAQIGVVSKYSLIPSVRVGFETAESLIDSNQDSSLLDNASGATNFSAPGASRLKLSPVIRTRSLSDANTVGFMPLADIQSGRVIRDYTDTQYGELQEELALRTREESGDYALSPFKVNVEEHLRTDVNSGVYTSSEGGDLNKLVIEVEPSVGYVKGYRTELTDVYRESINKATTYEVKENVVIGQNFGNYAICNEVTGTWDFQGLREVDIYDTDQQMITGNYANLGSVSGTKIGTAKVRGFQHHEGTSGTVSGKFRIYLFDLQMSSDKSFSDARSLYVNNTSGPDSYGDIVLETNGSAKLQDSSLNTLVFPIQSSGTRKLADATDSTQTQYVLRTEKTVTFTTSGTATVTANTAHTGGTEINNDTGSPLSSPDERNIIIVSKAEVATSPMTGQASQTGATITGSAGADFNVQYSVGDFIQIAAHPKQRIVNIGGATTMTVSTSQSYAAAGHSKVYPSGHIFDTQANGTITSTDSAHTIDLQTANLSSTFAASVYFDLLRTSATQANKTVNKNKYVHIDTGSHTDSSVGPWPLGVSDTFELVSVHSGANTSVTVDNGEDVTTHFYIDNGQRDSSYDTARLVKRATSSLDTTNKGLLIKFNYFGRDRSDGIGYMSVDSYPIDDANPSAAGSITTAEIPNYKTSSGNILDLRDSVDFRPIRSSTVTPSATGTAAAAPTNPISGTTFDIDGDGVYFPTPDQNFQCDVQSYLPRYDTVNISYTGDVVIETGAAEQIPSVPSLDPNNMNLAVIYIPPYPSLSTEAAMYYMRPDVEVDVLQADNRRFTMEDLRGLESQVNEHRDLINLNISEIAALKTSVLRPDDPVGSPEPPKDSIITDPRASSSTVNTLRSSDLSFTSNPMRAIPTLEDIELELSAGSVNTSLTDNVITAVVSGDNRLVEQGFATTRRPVTVSSSTPVKLYNGTMNLSHSICHIQQLAQPAHTTTTTTSSVISSSACNHVTSTATQTTAPATNQQSTHNITRPPLRRGRGFGGGGCFLAGSKVLMADGTSRSIESVQLGDFVLGRNGATNKVLQLHHLPVETRDIYTINESLELTDSHPVLTSSGWKSFNVSASNELHPDLDVSELLSGDKLVKFSELLSTHEDSLRTVHLREEAVAVYNLDVDGDDTFIVNNFVVHNK